MTTTTKKLSFAEYLAYSDSTDTRYELVDGELQQMSVGTGRHADITEFLHDQFREQIKQRELPWTAKQMTVGIRSPRGGRWDTSRIPDISVLTLAQWEAMADRAAVIDFSEPPPILIVEVVSPSTKTDDYRFKRSEYSVFDIPEYWIVDPLEAKVTICNLNTGLYDLAEYQGSQVIQSPIFPDLKLTATQVLSAKL